jgi:hypothetical protein
MKIRTKNKLATQILDTISKIAPTAIQYANGRVSALSAAKELSETLYFTWKAKEVKGPHKKIRIKSMALVEYTCYSCSHTIKMITGNKCPKCNTKMSATEHDLKYVHKKITDICNSHNMSKVSQNVFSYTPGVSIIDCARKHIKSYAIYAIDFKDFFFSFNLPIIEKYFYSIIKDEIAAKAMAICCVIPDPRKDTHTDISELVMPIGITPAGIISNAIPYELDVELEKYTAHYNLTYTRYSDNIYISSKEGHIPRTIEDEIIETVKCFNYAETYPFTINTKKTKYKPKWRRQTILGICVNVKLNIPRHRELRTKTALFGLYKDAETLYRNIEGEMTRPVHSPGGYLNRLRRRYKTITGHLSYIKSVNEQKYYKLLPMIMSSKFLLKACADIINKEEYA